MAMDSFSYTDNVRAAFASCLPCFTTSHSKSASNPPPNATNANFSEPRSTTSITTRPSSSNDLEHLLRDEDSDGISLHSNVGATAHRKARRRRRAKFSLTLFGYTLLGRPPIYLSDDEEDSHSVAGGGALLTNSSSTLDSDAAPLDASTIERLTSPDHFAALAARRESEQRQLEEEEAHRKAERRARRHERKARARGPALMSLTGAAPPPDADTFEGFQGSGNERVPPSFPFHHAVEVVPDHPAPVGLGGDGDLDGSNGSHSGDADDADLGGELYVRKKKPSGALSGSGSDSRSRTSASFSAGDTSHIQNPPTLNTHQSIPYPHTEMHLPAQMRKKHRASKRTSTVSSATSQSTSAAPYTPVESISETPAVATFPVPQEQFIRDGDRTDFPSVGLSGVRRPKSLDPKAFIAHQG